METETVIKKLTPATNPNHPKLLIIKEALQRRPELTKTHFARAYDMSHAVLKSWEALGFCLFGTPKAHPWAGRNKTKPVLSTLPKKIK